MPTPLVKPTTTCSPLPEGETVARETVHDCRRVETPLKPTSPRLVELARELGRLAARREIARHRGTGLIETALTLAAMSALMAATMLAMASLR